MKFLVALLAVVAPTLVSAGSGDLDLYSFTPSVTCETYDSSSPWYCPYQCFSYASATSGSTYFDITPESSVSGCECDELLLQISSSGNFTGSYYTSSASFDITATASAGYAQDIYVTFTDDDTSDKCLATFSIESGCVLDAGFCNNVVVTIYWWYWGVPVFVVVVIVSSVSASLRYRRLRALRLAQAGFYGANTVTTVGAPTVAYTGGVVTTSTPTAVVVA